MRISPVLLIFGINFPLLKGSARLHKKEKGFRGKT